MASAVIMEGGTCEPWWQERYHAPLFQPFPHFVERMMPSQHGEHHGFDPTPTREAMRWMGRDQGVDHPCHLQTS
jgi:hypothetical protein